MTSLIRIFYRLKLQALSLNTANKIKQSFLNILTESDKISSLIKDYRKNISFAQKTRSRKGNRIFESDADEKSDEIKEFDCIMQKNKRKKEIKSITIKLGRLLQNLYKNNAWNRKKDDNLKSYISSYTKAETIILPFYIESPRGFKYSTLFNGHRFLNCSKLNDTRRYSQITNSYKTALDLQQFSARNIDPNLNYVSKIPIYDLADKVHHDIYNDKQVIQQQDLKEQIRKLFVIENCNILPGPGPLLTGKIERISIEVKKTVKKKKDDAEASGRRKAKINFPTNRPESLCKKMKKIKKIKAPEYKQQATDD